MLPHSLLHTGKRGDCVFSWLYDKKKIKKKIINIAINCHVYGFTP